MSPMLTNLFGGMIVVLVVVGLDLLLGGKGLRAISRIFNRKLDVDSAVLKSLADLRLHGEKEVVRVDEATLQGRVRIFLAVLLLLPAIMLFFVVFLRR